MGKSTPSYVVGYEYRLGMQVVLGVHPINSIHEIRFDNKVAKQGTFSGGAISIDNPTFFQGGEVPDGLAGSIDLHIDGAAAFNAYLRNNYGIDFDKVPRFDEVAHIVFRGDGTAAGSGGFYVGNQPRPREMTIYAQRTTTACPYDTWALLPYTHPKWSFEVNDFNPVVLHWEMLQRGQSELYGDTWEAAAEVVHGEGLGVYFYGGGGDREALEQEILRYVNGRAYTDRATGLREIELIRADYDAETLPIIGAADIVGDPQIAIPDRSAAPNTFEVTFSDRAKMWKPATVTVQDVAHAAVFGVNRQAIDYKWVTRRSLAADLAWRDMVAQTQAGVTGSVRVSGLRPDLHEGSPFILDLPDWGQSTVVCRILSIRERGVRDNSVDVAFTQDVFGTDIEPIVVEDESVDTPTGGGGGEVSEALAATAEIAIEAPYWFGVTRLGDAFTDALTEDEDFGGVLTAATRATTLHMGYEAWTSVGGGAYAFRSASGIFTGSGTLVGDITRMQTSIVTTPITGLAVGHIILVRDAEFMRVDAITTGTTWTLTVGRGCIDTSPVAHPTGASIISLGSPLGIDQEFTAGQTVNTKLLPFTTGDTLALADADALPVTFNSRAYRPYPPGQFKVNGSYEGAVISADPVLTWVATNRLVELDETSAPDHDQPGTTGEVGTTYIVRAQWLDADDDSLGFVSGFSALNVGSVLTYTPDLWPYTPPTDAAFLAVSVASTRDGYESWTAPTIRIPVDLDVEGTSAGDTIGTSTSDTIGVA